MTAHLPWQEFPSGAANGADKLDAHLQDAIAHLHPLQRQHAIELHRQRQASRPRLQASLSSFTACTVPASCRARSRFLNLRDSVRKSPAKSTAKASSRPQIPWVPFSFGKVPGRGVCLAPCRIGSAWFFWVSRRARCRPT